MKHNVNVRTEPVAKKNGKPTPQRLPSPGKIEAIDALWDTVEALYPNRMDDALATLAAGLRDLLGADNIRWMAAVRVRHSPQGRRDPLRGWRLRASYDLIPDPPAYRDFIAWWFQTHNRVDPDFQIGLATQAMIAGAGKFRVHRMRDGWIPFAAFRRSEHFRLHYTELGITDRIWVGIPLHASAESVFLIDRCGGRPNFTKAEAELAEIALRRSRAFQRKLLLNHGLIIADRPLSPAGRRVLERLLSGLSEKDIAVALGHTPATVHTYVKTIYEQFGVNSRAALMALWLGSGGTEPK